MGASNTKQQVNHRSQKIKHDFRAHRRDYKVVSVSGTRLLDSGFLSQFNGQTASVPRYDRASSPYPTGGGNDLQHISSKLPVKKDIDNTPEAEMKTTKKVSKAKRECVCAISERAMPVTRHQSANQLRPPNKSPKKVSNNESAPLGSFGQQNRKFHSNSQLNVGCDDFHQGDIAFVSSTYGMNDSPKAVGKLTPTNNELFPISNEGFSKTGNNKIDTRIYEESSRFPQQSPVGDTQINTSPRSCNSKPLASVRHTTMTTTTYTSRLSEKPPTPPPKVPVSKTPTVVMQNSNLSIRPNTTRRRASTPLRYSVSTRTPPRDTTPKRSSPLRTNSLPRPCPKADQWARGSSPRSVRNSPVKSRPAKLVPQTQSDVDMDRQEKPPCLSRIEYTFYINDTEAYQRPFYDRRVEAIARASQCSICLHKPPPGQKPVYYKGIRVLPVTISARTMVTLKRCMARLDMQYPYFNVKAFCPPDMY